jgi:starch phosphorylase
MDLYAQVLGSNWYDVLDERSLWDKFAQADDRAIWTIHQARKDKLYADARGRMVERLKRLNASPDEIAQAEQAFDPTALTIGFARRVPTYKRATLIFRDAERLKRILNQPNRPVQFIFAGKAHPADEGGKALIHEVVQRTREAGFIGKIFFIEEYDMDLASYLVSGVDVWMNNPLPPLEASGTSGQKAAANGVLNMSVSDGWWAEAFNEKNGWLIGSPDVRMVAQEVRDEADAQALYYVLEQLVVPLYYQRDADGLPHAWIGRMKESIRSIVPVFSTRRMVKEYVARYIKAMRA